MHGPMNIKRERERERERERNLFSLTGFVIPMVQTVAKIEYTFTNTSPHRIK